MTFSRKQLTIGVIPFSHKKESVGVMPLSAVAAVSGYQSCNKQPTSLLLRILRLATVRPAIIIRRAAAALVEVALRFAVEIGVARGSLR